MLDLTNSTRLQTKNFEFLNELIDDAIEDLLDVLNDDTEMSNIVAKTLSKKFELVNQTKKQLAVTQLFFIEGGADDC